MTITAKITRRTRGTTLDRLAATIASVLDTRRGGRVKARTLDIDDAHAALSAHVVTLRAAKEDDLTAVTRASGGFVPNSYNHPAAADFIRITTEIATGATTIETGRKEAQRRSYGDGNRFVKRLVKAGQSQGRIVQ
jgi:hypothetical protein